MLTVEDASAALMAQLHAAYDDEPGMRVVHQAGEAFIADWCAGGCAMAYIRLDSMGPSTATFPDTDLNAVLAGPLVAVFHVGIARCVAVQDEAGNPPAAEQQTMEAQQFLTDARALRRVIACTRAAHPVHLPRKSVQLGRWNPQGPLGGCAGGYWPLSLRVK